MLFTRVHIDGSPCIPLKLLGLTWKTQRKITSRKMGSQSSGSSWKIMGSTFFRLSGIRLYSGFTLEPTPSKNLVSKFSFFVCGLFMAATLLETPVSDGVPKFKKYNLDLKHNLQTGDTSFEYGLLMAVTLVKNYTAFQKLNRNWSTFQN